MGDLVGRRQPERTCSRRFLPVRARGRRASSAFASIRNRPDGSVEAHLAGDESAVTRMIERMRRGPSNAQVEDFVIEEEAPESLGRFESPPLIS